MKYLLIDTNIFVSCCLLDIENDDDIKTITFLLNILDSNKAKLILPEVIELELDKKLKEKTIKIKKQINLHKQIIGKDSDLDRKIVNDMNDNLEKCIIAREKNTRSVRRIIKKIFNHKNIERIKLDPNLLVSSLKYYLRGEKPNNGENLISSDCLIIESVRTFLKGKNNYTLYFCSFNKNDFADLDQVGTKTSGPFTIHPDISKKIKHIEYFTNLLQLLNEHFEGKYEPEQIQKLTAKELSESMNDNKNIDIDSEPATTDQTVKTLPMTYCITDQNQSTLITNPMKPTDDTDSSEGGKS